MSTITKISAAWQKSLREQQEHMRKILEPLVGIQKLIDNKNISRISQQNFLGITEIHSRFKSFSSGFSVMREVTKMRIPQMNTVKIKGLGDFEGLKIGSTMSQQLKVFEQFKERWKEPPYLLGVVGSVKGLQLQFGNVKIPSIDFESAMALAKILGQEGLEAQLAYLGIESDGSIRKFIEAPEKGLLSHKQSDVMTLMSLLLTIISIFMALQMFYAQERAGAIQQARSDEQAAKHMQQLESLRILFEKYFDQAAEVEGEHYVVRERIASVRSRPEHGVVVEGSLMPNEVVRLIKKNGKWVEIEYYHWLHEEYCTGWVLKKYLERVPENYSRAKSVGSIR